MYTRNIYIYIYTFFHPSGKLKYIYIFLFYIYIYIYIYINGSTWGKGEVCSSSGACADCASAQVRLLRGRGGGGDIPTDCFRSHNLPTGCFRSHNPPMDCKLRAITPRGNVQTCGFSSQSGKVEKWKSWQLAKCNLQIGKMENGKLGQPSAPSAHARLDVQTSALRPTELYIYIYMYIYVYMYIYI